MLFGDASIMEDQGIQHKKKKKKEAHVYVSVRGNKSVSSNQIRLKK